MTKRRLRPWVKYALFTILILIVLFGLNKLLSNHMENHIETVSQECAKQGYGIKVYYTKSGDKFYTCNTDGGLYEK